MGYVFDAINRAGDRKPGVPGSGTPAAPEATNLSDAALDAVLQEQVARAAAAKADAEGTADQPSAAIEAPASSAPAVEAPPDVNPDPAEDPAPLPFDAAATGGLGTVDERLMAVVSPGSQVAEEYRSIRTSLLARWEQKRRLVHTITSATPQEGKTITSLNLGLSFSELRNRRVLVVEADLRLPTFANLLELREGPGMVHLLRGEASLDQVVQTVPGTRLHVIPAGERCPVEAIQLLSSPRASQILQTLRSKFDHVIIDTPPVTELADAGILGAQSDEVLMVVRMSRTPRPLVEQAVRTLKGYGARVSGVIATDQRRSRHKHYYYRYGYQYRYYSQQAA